MASDATQGIDFHTEAGLKEPLRVSSMKGVEALSAPYEFEFEFLSHQADVKLEDVVRQPANFGLKVPAGDGTRVRMRTVKIHGVMSRFEQLDKQQDWVHYRGVLVPRLWKFGLSVQSRVFLGKDVTEIVKEVLEAEVAGKKRLTSKDFEFKVSRALPKREYVVQYQETDLAFLSRWLEYEGIFYYFEQTEQGEKVVFTDDPKSCPDLPGTPTIPYRPHSENRSRAAGAEGAESSTEEGIRSLVCRHQGIPAKVVLKDYNYRTPGVALEAEATIDDKDEGEVYRYGEHYKDKNEGKALAKVRAEEIKCRQRVFTGRGDVRSFRAGSKFPLAEHYRNEFNAGAGYLLVEVRHKASQAFTSTGSPSGALHYENEFVCVPGDAPFRPERTTPWPRVAGVLHGAVDAGGDGKYAELDDQGRYKVKMPIDRSDRKDGKASRMVRMAQPYGGSNMGFHSPLHKKTEVLLGHTDGNPDRPLLLSSVPNPDTPSVVTSANQTQCDWKSGGNNEIRFEDQEGSEQIYAHAQKDLLTVVEHDEARQVKHDQTIAVTNDRTKTVDGNQSETVAKNKDIKIGGNHTETISGDKTLTVSGTHTETIVGNVTISENANKTETVAINVAETIGVAKALTIGAAYQVTVGAAMNETVGAMKAMEIGADYTQAVGANKQVTVAGNVTEAFGKSHSETAGEDFSLAVKKNIAIEAKESISIRCGKASIVLQKDGTILIEGKDLSIKGSGEIVAKADKDMTLKGKNILQN
ncbi:MAG TPA: type VI secretion system tip protein TssI/VgrG [Planctomycetota bacterium]|nr:type VI secretion system tip protein TssI/VgrG [Planctomycetota bacterium]